MTNRIFIIADTHFGHKRIIEPEFEGKYRPFTSIQEHDDELVRRWNEAVNKNDTVWHLGDVLFGRDAFSTLSRLNGVKKLVLGNHDRYPIALYAEHFSQIFGAVKLRDCILTHIPVSDHQFHRFRLNIHGHLHSNVMADPRYVNVSAERQNLAPKLLDTVIHEAMEALNVST